MGVDQVSALITMPGKVKLPDALLRHGVQIGLRIEAVIDAADVDIVDVEQDGAVRALGDLAQEFPFAHVGLLQSQVARYVFEQELPTERILYLADAGDHMRQRLLVIGEWQEIVQVLSADSGPAQVI